MRYLLSLLYTILSVIFDRVGKTEIGLVVRNARSISVLNTGTILAILRASGEIPLTREWLLVINVR